MEIQMMGLDEIRPYKNNPRINASAVGSVANSIKEFGFRQSIVVSPKRIIIVGHTRYLAAKKLELEKVPVHIAKGLTVKQIKAYRLADNKTNELSDWDFDLLPIELQKLKDMDFDMLNFGFKEEDYAIFDPVSSGDQPPLDETTSLKCPECGHEWSPS